MQSDSECPFCYKIPADKVQNLYWRREMYKKTLTDSSYCDILYRACQLDPIFFVNGFVWTYDTRKEPATKVPFILYHYQEQAFKEILSAINDHDLLIEKSRDMGASWLCVMAFLWSWLFTKRKSFLFVSRVEDYVDASGNPKSLFWKLDFALDNLPLFLKPIGYNKNIHRRKMHIENPENGSVIDGESTTRSVARGDRRSAILLDEFADVEEGFSVLSSTRDATPCRIFNSTPKGTGNAFYYMREREIQKLRMHWTVHPDKAKGLYETDHDGGLYIIDKDGYPIDYEPILDGKLRSPWYDEECKRAANQYEIAQELDIDYLGSGYQFFNADKIQVAIKDYARSPAIRGNLEYDAAAGEPIRFSEHPRGKIKLWCLLDGDYNPTIDEKLVFGADIASGTGSSNSVCVGYNLKTHEKILEYADPYIRPESFAACVVAILRWFEKDGIYKPLLIWEANGPGRQFGSVTKDVSSIPGFHTTKESKLVLLGDYRAAIESGNCINRSRVALEETFEYVFTPTGGVSGASANHGDRVIADALAWKCINEKRLLPSVTDRPEIPIGSLAWRLKMREENNRKTARELGVGW